ncbi:MAG: hypothetical protein Q4F96_00345 [Bacillota bacterium]|nr:hypothetical protein [Bacillota bacterium]
MKKASRRVFSTGIYYPPPGAEGQNLVSSDYERSYDFVGKE